MGLTAHQYEKMQELIALIKAGEKRILLKGSAGTGKTFMTNEVIRVLKTELYKYGAVYVTAPTHKALSVLKTKIEEKPYIHLKTIHSAHQLKRQIDFKTGKSKFVQVEENDRNPRFRAAQVVLCDEASMMETSILEYNDQHPNLLFIFIGDHKQLPPVGEKKSIVFTSNYPEVHLEEIVRQGKGSPIIELSNNLSLIKSKINIVNEIGGYVFENDRNYIIDRLANVNGTDEIKYLAWTNDDVIAMNNDVRRKIYGLPRRVELGESLIFTAPYKDFKNNQEIKVEALENIQGDLIIPTENTKFKVDAKGELSVVGDSTTYETIPIRLYLVNNEIQVLHEGDENLFNSKAKELKAKCKNAEIIWPAYYWFIERFAQITYNHALTVHKSQGSTFGTAIVNVGNIEWNRKKNPEETESMLYTAVTRAAKIVVLYNVR